MIGTKIRAKRRALGLTQTQLAKAVGVSLSAIVTWEKGTRSPRMAALKSLAIVLKCTVDELLKDDDNAARPV
jgi:transcriptional regulator with XRE-family HTH domain